MDLFDNLIGVITNIKVENEADEFLRDAAAENNSEDNTHKSTEAMAAVVKSDCDCEWRPVIVDVRSLNESYVVSQQPNTLKGPKRCYRSSVRLYHEFIKSLSATPSRTTKRGNKYLIEKFCVNSNSNKRRRGISVSAVDEPHHCNQCDKLCPSAGPDQFTSCSSTEYLQRRVSNGRLSRVCRPTSKRASVRVSENQDDRPKCGEETSTNRSDERAVSTSSTTSEAADENLTHASCRREDIVPSKFVRERSVDVNRSSHCVIRLNASEADEAAAVANDNRNATVSAHRCDQCGKTFRNVGRLRTHLWAAHTSNEYREYDELRKRFARKCKWNHTGVTTVDQRARENPRKGSRCGKKTLNHVIETKRKIPTVAGHRQKNIVDKNLLNSHDQMNCVRVIVTRENSAVRNAAVGVSTSSCRVTDPTAAGDNRCADKSPLRQTHAVSSVMRRHLSVKNSSGAKSHRCVVCDKHFKRANYLHNHSVIHGGERPYSCPQCQKKFSWHSNMRKHLSRVHRLGSRSCSRRQHSNTNADKQDNVARIKFRRPQQTGAVEDAEVSVTPTTPQCQMPTSLDSDVATTYRCFICDQLFANVNDMYIHSVTHGGGRPYSCRKCPKKFAWRSSMQRHVLMMHASGSTLPRACKENAEKQRCIAESTVFDAAAAAAAAADPKVGDKQLQKTADPAMLHPEIIQSQMDSYATKPHRCTVCDKRFYSLKALNRHLVVHSSDRPKYSCPYCKKNFLWLQCVRRHVSTMHKGDSRSLPKRRAAAVRYGSKERLYSCPHCQQNFTSRRDMRRHVFVIHDGGRRYQWPPPSTKRQLCETNTTYNTQDNIAEHVTTTSTSDTSAGLLQKDLSCTEKTAVPTKPRSRISRTGSDTVKPYHCAVCDRRFLRVQDMTRHMVVHTGDKPYSCKHCPKKFAWFGSIKQHELVVHARGSCTLPELRHPCEKSNSSGKQRHAVKRLLISAKDPIAKSHRCNKCDKRLGCQQHDQQFCAPLHSSSSTAVTNKCPHCEKRFIWIRNLRRHVCLAHATDDRQAFNTFTGLLLGEILPVESVCDGSESRRSS